MKNGLCMYLFPSFGWFTKGGVGKLKDIPVCFKASDIHCYTDFQKGCYQVTPEGKWGRPIRTWICRKYLVAIFPLFKNNNAFLFWTHRREMTVCFLCVCVCVLSLAWLFATSWTVAHQTPLFTESSRQEYLCGLPFPSPGDLPDPGTESVSLAFPALAGGFFTTEPPENCYILIISCSVSQW